MAVKVVIKGKEEKKTQEKSRFTIPKISGAIPRKETYIIKALKIMVMDIRMRLHPKETKERLEAYSRFSDLAYGRR